jgi:hypothetical protein
VSEHHDSSFQLGGSRHVSRIVSSALHLHRLVLDGETLDDTSDGLAAMSRNHHFETVLAKKNSNGVLLCASGSDTFRLGGTLASVSSNIRAGVVTGGGRFNVIGTGGNKNAISSNGGVTWSAGGDTGLISALVDIALCSSGLVVATGNGGSAYSSNGGTSWTNPVSGSDISDAVPSGGVTSLGVVTGDVLLAVGVDGSGHPKFARSTNAGVTWAAATGTVPTAAGQNDAGSVVGLLNGGALHAGHRNVTTIEIAQSSEDGQSWTSACTPIVSLGTVSAVRLMSCPNTGLVVLAALLSTGIAELRYSPYRGQAWSDPIYVADIDLNELAVAGGRLFASNSGAGMMFASGRVL